MKRYGFTLIEVIVVAVIVAVLALVAVQIYFGYVDDCRQQVAQNCAASAATYLNARVNLLGKVDDLVNPLEGDNEWSTLSKGGMTPSTFSAPEGVVVTINENGTVTATLNDQMSTPIPFQ